jgi:hypothetical protein
MLGIVLAALTVSPSPSPTPLLKTIITVKSTPLCGAFAAHTNAAIGSAVQNDQTLGSTILTLRSDGLAGTTLDRNFEIHRLTSLADSIYKQYRAGLGEVNQLRDLAKQATDPDEQAEMKAAADALGGALYRQHLIQQDLDGFVAFLEASDMMTDDNADGPRHPMTWDARNSLPLEATDLWLPNVQNAVNHPALLVGSESLADDVTMARAASADFLGRVPAIMQDELMAGSHIELAADHC